MHPSVMTPQERFYKAVAGGRADRVPVLPKIWLDLAANLMHRTYETVLQSPALAMETVIEAALEVNADAARLFHFPPRNLRRDGDLLVEVDARGIVGAIDVAGGFATHVRTERTLSLSDPLHAAFVQFWSSRHPYVNTVDDIKRIAVPDKTFYEAQFGGFQRPLMEAYRDRIALIGDCGSATLAYYILLRGMENALMDMLDAPALVHAGMEKGTAIAIAKGKFNIDCGLNILRLNDSVANMSVISPSQWRTFVMPHVKTVCDELHHYGPQVKIYCHICGNTLPVLNDILSAGIDCIGPLDPLGGFTCAQARAAVGPQASLMGGMQTLAFVDAAPDAIEDEARTCIEQAGESGAFVLGSGCALPRFSKKENLLALHTAAVNYGTYAE